MSSNEGKACDAVLLELERRIGAPRHDLVFPAEPAFPRDQQVEVIGFVGSQKFAIEHTYVEPFDGFRMLGQHVGDFKRVLLQRINANVSFDSSYDLALPINVLNRNISGRSLERTERICTDIAKWVRETAPTLHRDPSDRSREVVRNPTREIPFTISLRRRDLMQHEPRFTVYSVVPVPKKSERLRTSRLRIAYNRKLPKLLALKATGARTVLVLEENDLSGTNSNLVGAAIRRIEKGRSRTRPDEVYLLSTSFRDQWGLYPIRIDRRWVHDKGGPGNRYRPCDPARLRDITTEGRASGGNKIK